MHCGKIPKPNEEEGLGLRWPCAETDMERLKKDFEDLKSKV